MKLKAYMRPFYVVLFLLMAFTGIAQKQRLIVGGYTPTLYINYDVSPNQTFASIASIYNLVPDSLSEFNNIDYYDGPLLAKSLKVPLTSQNFTQKGIADSSEVLVPIYHMVTYNESLQQVSTKANRLPLSSLKKWNVIPPTGIVKGMPILIGFLKAKADMIAHFEDTVSVDLARVDKPSIPKKPEVKIDNNVDTSAVAVNPETAPVKTDVKQPRTEIKDDSSATLVTIAPEKKTVPKKTAKKAKVDSAAIAATTEKKLDTAAVAINTGKAPSQVEVKQPKIETKADTSATVAANTAEKKTVIKKPDEKEKVDPTTVAAKRTKKLDTASVATKSGKVPSKVEVRQPSIEGKVDTSATVSTNTAEKTIVIKTPEEKVKLDSTLIAAEPVENTDPKKSMVDSSAVALNIGNDPNNKKVTEQPKAIEDKKSIVEKSSIEDEKKLSAGAPAESKGNVQSTKTAANTTSLTSAEEMTFEGIFKDEIAVKPGKQLSGEASYFQSKSGWTDKKYYVLMPHVPAGTIVKITSIDNRSVYAKVLGAMPDMKENNGILLRLSDAALTALGVKNDKFPVVVNYY